jgi:molecular chaperone GrpE
LARSLSKTDRVLEQVYLVKVKISRIQEVFMSKHHSHSNRGETPETRETAENQSVPPAAGTVSGGAKAAGLGGNSGESFAETPEKNPAGVSPEEGMKESPAQDRNDGDGEVGDSEGKIAELEARLAEAEDQFLRKAADFENFRKRMNREKQDAIDFANQSLLLDLVPIIDDFERALKSSETSKDFNSLYEGIGMIEKRLSSQLESKWGLKRFDSEGEPFDPNRHEALMMEKSAEVTEPKVIEDFLKGYTLRDRVVRSAKVKVLMPENPGREEAAESPGDEKGSEEQLHD